MNIILMLFNRKKGATVALTLFITCSIILGSVGIIAQISGRHQMEAINSNYTTIATPGDRGYYGGLIEEDENGKRALEEEKNIKDKVICEDRRSFFIAHTPECTSVTPYEFENYSSYLLNGSNNCLAVVAVECLEISPRISEYTIYETEDGEDLDEPIEYNLKTYDAKFKLNEMVCCSEGYFSFENIQGITLLNGLIHDENGEIPFVVGKKYLLFAPFLSNHGIVKASSSKDIEEWIFPDPFYLSMQADVSEEEGSLFSKAIKGKDMNEQYYVLEDTSLPYCKEYDESVAAFLESDSGKRWKEEVIPFCQENYQSACVIATDNIDSISNFNSGIATIMEGGSFRKEDYAEGKRVCLVSSLYAQKNLLNVGDSIKMELYSGELFQKRIMTNIIQKDKGEVINSQGLLREENKIGITEEWVIAGIYSAPEFESGEQNFNANTIFIPKTSVPNAEKYEDCYNALLFSIILKNGVEKEFKKAIEPYVKETPFNYSNQGYDAVKGSLITLKQNINRLTLTCSIGAIITFFVVVFLFWKRVASVVNQMRMLGCSKGRTLKQAMIALIPIIGISGVLGRTFMMVFCKKILSWGVKMEVQVQSSTMVVSVITEMMIVFGILSIIGAFMLRHRLINKKME